MSDDLFRNFCFKIISLDKAVRFTGITDGHGRILASAEREGLVPLLNQRETEQYAITAAARQFTRVMWQPILGKIEYTSSFYDKLLRINIPLTDSLNHLSFVIIITFDVETENYHEIMQSKIISYVKSKEEELFKVFYNKEV